MPKDLIHQHIAAIDEYCQELLAADCFDQREQHFIQLIRSNAHRLEEVFIEALDTHADARDARHDISNPITTIWGYVSIVEKLGHATPELRPHFASIRQATHALLDLIDTVF